MKFHVVVGNCIMLLIGPSIAAELQVWFLPELHFLQLLPALGVSKVYYVSIQFLFKITIYKNPFTFCSIENDYKYNI